MPPPGCSVPFDSPGPPVRAATGQRCLTMPHVEAQGSRPFPARCVPRQLEPHFHHQRGSCDTVPPGPPRLFGSGELLLWPPLAVSCLAPFSSPNIPSSTSFIARVTLCSASRFATLSGIGNNDSIDLTRPRATLTSIYVCCLRTAIH
jgi:hypothetical protein